MLSANTRQAYTEIDNFIELLDEYNRNKVPKKLREYFKKEKDDTYTKTINPNIPIKEQNLKEETLALIAALNLQYWCEDEEEKRRLKKVYSDNEIKYQQQLRKMYNSDDMFRIKNKKVELSNPNNELSIVEYKKSIVKRIISKIKRILHIN